MNLSFKAFKHKIKLLSGFSLCEINLFAAIQVHNDQYHDEDCNMMFLRAFITLLKIWKAKISIFWHATKNSFGMLLKIQYAFKLGFLIDICSLFTMVSVLFLCEFLGIFYFWSY